jgi:hypothetical protein
MKATASAAARVAAGDALAGTLPAAVAGLGGFALRLMIMKHSGMIVA